ncbi:MAG: NAD(P)-dependent oxidoreductase [Armatimonadota bacterium]
MRIAVIGANGQLGTELAAIGQKRGHDIVAFTHADVQVERGDGVSAVVEVAPDVVINSAFRFDMEGEADTALKSWQVNVALPLVRCCGEIGARYVYISTDYVFDGQTGDYAEDDPCRPLSLYGATKRAGELAALHLLENAAVCRVSYLFGHAGCRAKGGENIVDLITEALRERRPLELDDDTRFSPTYAVDAAEQIFEVIENHPQPGVYHCSNSGACSYYDFALAVAEIMQAKHDFQPRYDEPEPLRPKHSNLLNTRLPEAPPWRDGVRRYLQEKDGECGE